MINVNVIGIIPARSKSKRVVDKNIKLLNGQPLMTYTIAQALKAESLKRVIVTTDSQEYIKIAHDYGAEAYLQPAKLSVASAALLPALQFCVRRIERSEKVDVIVILQPTTPFRLSKDIDAAVNKLLRSSADSVISVCEVSEPPQWMFKIGSHDKMISLLNIDVYNLNHGHLMKRKLPRLVMPNGAIYVTWRRILMDKCMIYGNDCRAFIMPVERSLDIDTESDFKYAEYLMREKKL